MKKRIILLTFFAVLIFIVFTVFTLSACSNNNANPDADNENANPEESADNPIETTSEAVKDDLPDMDFGGYEFRILQWPDAGGEHTNIVPESQNGDVLNDAVYNANARVEDRFNIEIKQVMGSIWSDAPRLVKQQVISGEDLYDLTLVVDRDAMNLIMEGKYFLSTDELPNINPDKPYWDKYVNEMMSIGGKNYFMYGSNMLSTMDYMCFLVYNKQIMQNEGITENIYDLIRNGKWTMDKMYEIGRAAHKDTNGDGVYTAVDQWGMMISGDYYYPSFWYANKEPLIAKDSDDMPYFNVPGNQRLFDIFQKQFDLSSEGIEFNVGSNKLDPYKLTGSPYTLLAQIFADGHGLFSSTTMYLVQTLRNMDADYGIVPYPTYDEQPAGTPYFSRIMGGIPLLVPSNNKNPEMTSTIMEALACEYYLNVIPSYYDLAVQEKATRDDESRDILDMLTTNKFMDSGDSIWMSVRAIYQAIPGTGKNTFASQTEKNEASVNKMLDKAIEVFNTLN